MEDEVTGMDDSEIDPAIAEAMGFSGFGTQAGKKRKFDMNDGVADVNNTTDKAKGQGANALPLGMKKMTSDQQGSEALPSNISRTPAKVATSTADDSTNGPSLQDLRNGVRNANGDMVYFLPSFIEDPWKDLKPK